MISINILEKHEDQIDLEQSDKMKRLLFENSCKEIRINIDIWLNSSLIYYILSVMNTNQS